jgi:ribulose-5-phosphate 4-epimerase/fuculose-1-phosphate aldolase
VTGKCEDTSPRDIFRLMRDAGRAMMLTDGNNTHSGNIAMRDRDDRDVFYVTSSGSQQGALVQSDIVPLRFSNVSWGDARASTESTIHRRILSLPGVEAAIHAHYVGAISVSFDSKEKCVFLYYEGGDSGGEEFSFVPIDLIGAKLLGNVPSGSYAEPVGSKEMEERIPKYLAKSRVTLVKGHGPFVRGTSVEECLHMLTLADASARLLIAARFRGVDTGRIVKRIREKGASSVYPQKIKAFELSGMGRYETDDASTIESFRERARFNFYQRISPYGTGSMSEKITGGEMLYCPIASTPEGFEIAVRRMDIEPSDADDWETALHKTIYSETNDKACMITMNPYASAEGMALLAERYGVEALVEPQSVHIDYSDRSAHPVVVPIDAEAFYLNPRVGLVNSDAPHAAILDMLRWHKGACYVAGIGVVGTGKVTIEQAAHHCSSGETIARIRQTIHMAHRLNAGPPVSFYAPETQ